MEKLDFKELLKETQTLEAIKEAHAVLRYISGKLEETEEPAQNLTEDQRSVLAAALLIAYGRAKLGVAK